MRHFCTLLLHEIRLLLISTSTYIAAIIFLLLMGSIYLLGLQQASQGMQRSPLTLFFQLFWIPVFFMVPLLTMKSIAEERRLGTFGMLLTTPTGPFAIVFSKFTAAYIFYLLLWGLSAGFPLITHLSIPEARLSSYFMSGATLGGYIFIATSGALFIAIGIFSSSLTRSTLVAGILSFSLLFILILSGHLLTQMPLTEVFYLKESFHYLQILSPLDDCSRGIIDTRPFLFDLSGTFFILLITTLFIKSKS